MGEYKGNDAICIVKLTTRHWLDTRGVHLKKSLVFLKRKCNGYNILVEDCESFGAEEVIPKIININEAPDGVYLVAPCNESKDWESGHIDDYDYKLVPITTNST